VGTCMPQKSMPVFNVYSMRRYTCERNYFVDSNGDKVKYTLHGAIVEVNNMNNACLCANTDFDYEKQCD
jgi:hypothetical protein